MPLVELVRRQHYADAVAAICELTDDVGPKEAAGPDHELRHPLRTHDG